MGTKGTWQNAIAGGLSAVGLSLIAVAAKNLGRKLCVTSSLSVICTLTAVITLLFKKEWLFPAVILGGGIVTLAEVLYVWVSVFSMHSL